MTQGLYVSYNELKNGPFNEAIQISKERGCVTWLDSFKLDPAQLPCPTDIIIRLAGKERYFRGTLLAIASADTLDSNFLDGERNHRPTVWQQRGQRNAEFKSVLFISHLQEEEKKPREVENSAPPQHPTYVDL